MSRIAGNKQKTIRKQIQLAIIAISVVSMLVLGICFYTISTRNVENNYKEDFSYNLKTADNIITIQFDNIVELMRSLLTNSGYINTLLNADEVEGIYFDSSQIRSLENSTSEITLQSEMVQEVLTVSLDGKLYVHSKKGDTSQYYELFRNKNIVSEDWAKTARDKKGKEAVVGNNVLTGAEDIISIIKYIIDPSSGEAAGYMIVNVYKKIFDKAFDNGGNYVTNCFLLLDTCSENQCVFYQGNVKDKEKIYNQYTSGEDSDLYVLCTRESSIDHWVMISGISSNELNEQRKDMAGLIIGLIILLIIVGIVVSYNISDRIYKPLRTLETTIQQVEEGERNITVEFDNSEIGLLGQKFKETVNHNLVLRERLLFAKIKQREQELHVLQEQINPHFLYNTLDALYCMAEIHGADDIAKMVSALSETFRLSLNKGSNFIDVKDEIEHIKAYMTIQNMRFNDRFELVIDVEEVKNVKIMKLILQPFVENAIVHGLEPKLGKGKIIVLGKREKDGDILFTVADDGVGVDDMKKLEQGYGIINVKERIQLYYGERYGISFESAKNIGTTVSIRISEVGMGSL